MIRDYLGSPTPLSSSSGIACFDTEHHIQVKEIQDSEGGVDMARLRMYHMIMSGPGDPAEV